MTIQNIEDVMDRIMSLNRNLTEESLKTLLSASGWDREDIMEGLRIFKNTNKSTVLATPVTSTTVDPNRPVTAAPAPSSAPAMGTNSPIINNSISNSQPAPAIKENNIQDKNQSVYTFNLKKRDDTAQAPIVEETQNTNTNEIQNSGLQEVYKMNSQNIDVNNTPVTTTYTPAPPSPVKASDHKSVNVGKLIFYILLVLILGVVVAYFYSTSFAKFVNEDVLGQKPAPTFTVTDTTITTPTAPTLVPEVNSINTAVATSASSTFVTINTASSSVSNTNSTSIEDLVKEIAILRSELNKYKNKPSSTKTIVQYLYQRGPTGAAGRGIDSIDATSTGFVINYSDNTSVVVPYSTTTILNILNSQGVCFRDSNSNVASTSDVCLDKDSVLKLLNK